MESIRNQAEAEETAAAADEKREEEDEDNNDDWDGNFGKNIQDKEKKGEEAAAAEATRADRRRTADTISWPWLSTPVTGSPDVGSYALVIDAWAQRQSWNLRDEGCGGGGGATRIYPSSSRRGSLT